MGALDRVINRLTRDVESLRKGLDTRPTLRLGTVTAVAPLRIHLDGDSNPLPATPGTLVPVGPGDRVTVAHQKRTVTILGVVSTSGRPWRLAAGVATVTGDGNPATSVSVPFPAGRFTRPPVVVVAAEVNTHFPYVGTTSATSTRVGLRQRLDNGWQGESYPVHWHAIQMSPTSAGG